MWQANRQIHWRRAEFTGHEWQEISTSRPIREDSVPLVSENESDQNTSMNYLVIDRKSQRPEMNGVWSNYDSTRYTWGQHDCQCSEHWLQHIMYRIIRSYCWPSVLANHIRGSKYFGNDTSQAISFIVTSDHRTNIVVEYDLWLSGICRLDRITCTLSGASVLTGLC